MSTRSTSLGRFAPVARYAPLVQRRCSWWELGQAGAALVIWANTLF